MAQSVKEGLLQVGTTGDYLDTAEIKQTDGTPAHRENVVIASPTDNDARIEPEKPENHPDYHIPTEDPHTEAINDTLHEILDEMKLTNILLQGILK